MMVWKMCHDGVVYVSMVWRMCHNGVEDVS